MNENTALLRNILTTLREIRDALRSGVGKATDRSSSSSTAKGGKVASDRELDSDWGNPVVRKDPRGWKGDSFVGCRFSECPPEYLDELASLFDWMGDKDEEEGKTYKGKPTAPYKRSDAGRARGWAKRLRDGWKPSNGAAGEEENQNYGGVGNDEPLPF